jgi:N,N'-diacetylchitobiose phosphorylase
VPANWKTFKMTRHFRSKFFNIEVKNETGVQKSVLKLVVNGEEISGNFIPLKKMIVQNIVLVIMG